jgi:hypothetical protein
MASEPEEVTPALAVFDDAVNRCMEGSQARSADGVAQRDQESVYTEVKNHRFFRPNNHRAERDHKVSEHLTEGETCHKTEGFHPAHYDDDGQNVGEA